MIKKITKFIISLTLVITSFTILGVNITDYKETNAESYGMKCPAYEVDYTNNAGGFDLIGCYNDLNSAKNMMYSKGQYAVIRHAASVSPMKIIDMGAGIAISYPRAANISTEYVYQYLPSQGVYDNKITYVTQYRDMAYLGLATYNGNGGGYIHVNLTGFDGYVALEDVDLVPMMWLEKEVGVTLGGSSTTDTYYIHSYQSYFKVIQNGNYKELQLIYSSGYPTSSSWPQIYYVSVGPAADWMNVNDIYYSMNGYDFYTDRYYQNFKGTFYNYYQFLPIRTKSDIPASAYDKLLNDKNVASNSKIRGKGSVFINAQETYGANAALVFAMACLESAYGTSRYALERNNLFGWNAFDSNPDSASYFSSIDQAIYEHAGINLRGYSDVFDARFFGSHLGNKGSGFNVKYAADPYWGYKIAGIMYNLDKAANNYNGKLTDYNKYTLGLINQYDASVKLTASSSATTLYKTAYGPTYQNNFIAPLVSEKSGYYGLITTNGIRTNNTVVKHKVNSAIQPLEAFNWTKSIGYLPTSQIKILNDGNSLNSKVGKEPTGDYVKTSTIAWSGDDLIINGTSYQPGIYVTKENTIKQSITMYDEYFAPTQIALTTKVTNNDNVAFNSKNIVVKDLEVGKYYFEFNSTYSAFEDYSRTYNFDNTTKIPATKIINNKVYSFKVETSGEDKILFMTVEDVPTPSPSPTPSPTVTPTPSPTISPSPTTTPEGLLIRVGINTIDTDTENNELDIEGYAFIKGMDATDQSKIKQTLILTNMEDGTKKEYECETYIPEDYGFNFYDGFTYDYVGFKVSIDAKDLTEGNYTWSMKVDNDSTSLSTIIQAYEKELLPEVMMVDETNIRLSENQISSYRLELAKDKIGIDYSKINKPTLRTSMIAYNNISLKDATLSIDGVGWIYNVNHGAKNNLVYNVVIANKDGEVTNNSMENYACEIDYTTSLKSNYDFSNACFKGNIDLSTLADGKYVFYLDIATKTNRDIFEMYDLYDTKIEATTYNNRTYSMKFTKIRGRLELEIVTK